MKTARRTWIGLSLVGALLVAGTAQAQPRPATADDAFAEARDRYAAQDYVGALPLFRQAVEASNSPNARIYLARCLRELGQLVEAYDEMIRTVRDARELAPTEERYAQTRDAAAGELAVLEGSIGKVIVALGASLKDATVELNGQALSADRIGTPVTVLPGEVVVAARRKEGSPIEVRKVVAAGALETIMLSEPGVAGGPTPAPDGTPAPVEPSGASFGAVRGAGIGVALVGVAGFVTLGVAQGIARSKLSTLETECGGTRCTDPSYADVVDAGKAAETASFVGLGIGVAGAVAGTIMIAVGGGGDGDDVAVGAGPGSAMLRVRF